MISRTRPSLAAHSPLKPHGAGTPSSKPATASSKPATVASKPATQATPSGRGPMNRMMVDVGTFKAVAPPTPAPDGLPDKSYDGFLLGANGKAYPPSAGVDNIPTVKPQDGRTPNDTIVFVNGMSSDKAHNASLCQELANTTGAQVVGVDNATEGQLKDLLQCVTDTFNKGNNPATATLSNIIYDKMMAGQPLHVMGYSQGGIITSDAIQDAQNRMMLEGGMSQAQVQDRMRQLLKVETVASGAHTFPDGPEYVHYVNRADPVAMTVGLGSHLPIVHPGADAKVREFTDFSWSLNPFAGHDFSKYMAQWEPFNQAWGNA